MAAGAVDQTCSWLCAAHCLSWGWLPSDVLARMNVTRTVGVAARRVRRRRGPLGVACTAGTAEPRGSALHYISTALALAPAAFACGILPAAGLALKRAGGAAAVRGTWAGQTLLAGGWANVAAGGRGGFFLRYSTTPRQRLARLRRAHERAARWRPPARISGSARFPC